MQWMNSVRLYCPMWGDTDELMSQQGKCATAMCSLPTLFSGRSSQNKLRHSAAVSSANPAVCSLQAQLLHFFLTWACSEQERSSYLSAKPSLLKKSPSRSWAQDGRWSGSICKHSCQTSRRMKTQQELKALAWGKDPCSDPFGPVGLGVPITLDWSSGIPHQAANPSCSLPGELREGHFNIPVLSCVRWRAGKQRNTHRKPSVNYLG